MSSTLFQFAVARLSQVYPQLSSLSEHWFHRAMSKLSSINSAPYFHKKVLHMYCTVHNISEKYTIPRFALKILLNFNLHVFLAIWTKISIGTDPFSSSPQSLYEIFRPPQTGLNLMRWRVCKKQWTFHSIFYISFRVSSKSGFQKTTTTGILLVTSFLELN